MRDIGKFTYKFAKWTSHIGGGKKGEVKGVEDTTCIFPDDVEGIGAVEYCLAVAEHFATMPEVAKPLINSAERTLGKIEQMLFSAPAFINVLQAVIPEETFQVIMTDEQKAQIASGALKLMTKKDGSLMANLINPKTKKIVSSISLEKVKLSPEISQAMTSYAAQMQMAQIAEQIQLIQVAIEEIRQGQEHDRLATAYSCQQKLFQAMAIKNSTLRSMALLSLIADAEDSRNLLMQSQNANIAFIQKQPESYWGKLLSGAPSEKVDARMAEIRGSLCAINMVSLAEAMAYQELGEMEAAHLSLQYYADYIQNTYLKPQGLIERLDMIDPSPENYWSKELPKIAKQIEALPCHTESMLTGGNEDGRKEM